MSARLSPGALEAALDGLSQVPQDPIYHGEGDVLAHTRLVIDRLEAMDEYRAMDEAGREILHAAAMLHDLGKRACTRLEDGRWRSPHHGSVGARMTRAFLMTQLGLCGTPEDLQRREAICALIQWHMRPAHALDVRFPGREVRQMASLGALAPDFSLERLALLAEADCRGRVCPDMAELLERVELFRMLAKEERCYRAPYAHADAYSRYVDLAGGGYPPDQPVYDGTWGRVVMMSGLPGTGKDAYIARHFPELPMVSLDELRRELQLAPGEDEGMVAQTARERARELLRQGQPFVFNATNLSRMIRDRWTSLFHAYGAAVQIVYLEADWAERQRRNRSRHSAVPEPAVERMLRNMTPPSLTEAEDVRWICT